MPAIVAAGRPATGRDTVSRAVGAATPVSAERKLTFGRVSSQTDSGAVDTDLNHTHVRIRNVPPLRRRSAVDVAVPVAPAAS